MIFSACPPSSFLLGSLRSLLILAARIFCQLLLGLILILCNTTHLSQLFASLFCWFLRCHVMIGQLDRSVVLYNLEASKIKLRLFALFLIDKHYCFFRRRRFFSTEPPYWLPWITWFLSLAFHLQLIQICQTVFGFLNRAREILTLSTNTNPAKVLRYLYYESKVEVWAQCMSLVLCARDFLVWSPI